MDETLLGFSAASYFAAAVFYTVCGIKKSGKAALSAAAATWTGWLLNSAAMGIRYVESIQAGFGYVPLSNMYETMIFFAWAIVLIYLIFFSIYKTKILGAFVAPLAFLAIAVVRFNPAVSGALRPLPPELQSHWLTYHVIACAVAYAAFAISFALSIMYLIWGAADIGALPKRAEGKITQSLGRNLENLSYKAVALGFPFLTLGIIIGAIWAKEAWGSHWSWDPKETWSFITWIIYAAFLHARLTAGWRGVRLAWLSVLGFIAVLLTYWGVTYILPGRHSYAS